MAFLVELRTSPQAVGGGVGGEGGRFEWVITQGAATHTYTLLRPNYDSNHYAIWAEGWVNLYQKFEIQKYTVCGKFILPKKWKGIF